MALSHVEVEFLPKNTTSTMQQMDQERVQPSTNRPPNRVAPDSSLLSEAQKQVGWHPTLLESKALNFTTNSQVNSQIKANSLVEHITGHHPSYKGKV